MSDTKTVREKCKHGRYERHQYQTSTFITKFWCEGGKEIELRVEVAGKVTYYEGEVVEE